MQINQACSTKGDIMTKVQLTAVFRHELIGSLNKNRHELMELSISELTQLVNEAKTLEFSFGIAVTLMESLIAEKRRARSGKARTANPQR
jgi:hypothetical protein